MAVAFKLLCNLLRDAISMFYVYIIQSFKTERFYIGYTSNLKKRFESHNLGKNLSTKLFIPYKLIFYEAFLDKTDAKNREKYLKSGWGRKNIKKILSKYFDNKF